MVSLILKGRFGPRYSIINGRWKKERKIGKNLERPFIVKKVFIKWNISPNNNGRRYDNFPNQCLFPKEIFPAKRYKFW